MNKNEVNVTVLKKLNLGDQSFTPENLQTSLFMLANNLNSLNRACASLTYSQLNSFIDSFESAFSTALSVWSENPNNYPILTKEIVSNYTLILEILNTSLDNLERTLAPESLESTLRTLVESLDEIRSLSDSFTAEQLSSVIEDMQEKLHDKKPITQNTYSQVANEKSLASPSLTRNRTNNEPSF